MYDTTKPYTKKILELTKETQTTPYGYVENGLFIKNFNYPEYHHSDGIGNKGKYHLENRTFKNAVIDGFAMNYNDLLMKRATPYAVIDYLVSPEEGIVIEIIQYLCEECKKRDIAITGGETAIHEYQKAIDLAITMLGFVKNPKPNEFKVGDVLIGLENNGLHSNGFTKVIETFSEDYKKYLNELTKPTIIYDTLPNIYENYEVHGMQHITGGAFTKLRDLLDRGDAIIVKDHNLEPQEIFRELYGRGVSDEEMYKTFNCGIGFILSVPEDQVKDILDNIGDSRAEIIGKVVPGTGKIKIESKFSDKEIKF